MPWNAMFRAARYVHRYTSVSLMAKRPYLSAGPTKQFVWPYLFIHHVTHLSNEHKTQLTWSLGVG